MKKKDLIENYNKIMEELKKGIFRPVYFLAGEETYYIDQITNFIINNALEEHERDFNQVILYGEETKVEDIINAARQYPMMAKYLLVIVKEAQRVKNIKRIKTYCEKPLKSTILVINYKYKSFDARKAENKDLINTINKQGIFFLSKKIPDYKITQWIQQYLKNKNISIDNYCATLLAEYIGNNLSAIINELDKLIITLPKNSSRITSSHIEKYTSISKDFNTIELCSAVGKKDIYKAYQIIHYFEKNPVGFNISSVIYSLYNYFCKILIIFYIKKKPVEVIAEKLGIHSFFVKEYLQVARIYGFKKTKKIISLLREYDMKSKGVGCSSTPPGGLLKELVYKIFFC